MVRRAHEGLGHPEVNRFVRILRHSKAPEEAIEIAGRLRCSVCEAYKLPSPARPAAPPREQYHVNDLVGIDTVHLRDHQNQTVPALNMIDWSTHFQLVIPMAAETAREARKAYRQWVRFFGPPRKLLLDLGTEFKSDFRRMAEADGSEVLPSSLEAPTQRGLTERAGGLFKDILYKTMRTYDCQTEEHWKELVDITCMTRNRLLMRAGYSPIQRVGTTKKTRESYWHGPGRVLMTALPSTVWIAYQGTLIKAAPERIRPVTEEESLSMSGWLNGISAARKDFERVPIKNFVDLTKDNDLPPLAEDEEDEPPTGEEPGPLPSRRVVRKTANYATDPPPLGLEQGPTPEREGGQAAHSEDIDMPDGEEPGTTSRAGSSSLEANAEPNQVPVVSSENLRREKNLRGSDIEPSCWRSITCGWRPFPNFDNARRQGPRTLLDQTPEDWTEPSSRRSTTTSRPVPTSFFQLLSPGGLRTRNRRR